jgi:hypothetical protein
MLVTRSASLDILYDGQHAHEPYLDVVRSLTEGEFDSHTSVLLTGSRKRFG